MDWHDLTPELSVLIPHCPEPTQVVELRRAARQFCQDSRIWSRPFQLYTVAGLDRYVVDPPEQASIVATDWLSLNGRRLDGRSTAQFSDQHPGAMQARPREYYHYPGGELILSPTPDRQYVVEGAMALQPVRAATRLPDWLGDEWGDGIISLAAARLAMVPGKAWSDERHRQHTAQAQLMIYDRELRRAIQRKKAADQPATRVVQYGGL